MNRREIILLKLAEAEERGRLDKMERKVKRFFGSLGSKHVTKRELKVIKKQVKQTRAKSEKEKQLERLSGRRWTPGQYLRGAGIGAGMGAIGHMVGSAIEGATKGTPPSVAKAVFNPRGIARAAAVGAIYGSALPAARRLADIEAAKRGKF